MEIRIYQINMDRDEDNLAFRMEQFVSLYGEKKWSVSIYDSNCSLIRNYINPIIGHLEIQSITPLAVDKYIQTLRKTPCVSTKTHKATSTYVSDRTIEKVIKLLRCVFGQAIRWEKVSRNDPIPGLYPGKWWFLLAGY